MKNFELKDAETSPPSRYNSGSLILAMENAGKLIEDEELREQIKGAGIGTSATRGEIIKKLEKIKHIEINPKTLKNERISKFEMSGKYGFIRTFSGSGVLFRVASGRTVAKIINKIDLDIAIPGRDKKADYALVYSRDTGEIWNIDSRHNKLNKIDLPYEYLNYLYTDNGKILISSDNTVYGELDSFLTKK